MKKIVYTVSFEIMTSEYIHTSTNLQTSVLAVSYNDAAEIVKDLWGMYEGFKLGIIKPTGIPRTKSNLISSLLYIQ